MADPAGSEGREIPPIKRPRLWVTAGGLLMALTGFAIYGGLHSAISNEAIRLALFTAIMFPLFIAALRWVNRGETDESEGHTSPRVKRPLFQITIGGMLMLMTLVAIYSGLHRVVSNEAPRLVAMIAISFLLFIASLAWEKRTKPIRTSTAADYGITTRMEETIFVWRAAKDEIAEIGRWVGGIRCDVLQEKEGLGTVQQITKMQPALVILNIAAGDYSGFEVCKALKSNPITRGIPVLLIGGRPELGDVERAVESATDDFLSKPLVETEFLKRVQNLLRLSAVSRD